MKEYWHCRIFVTIINIFKMASSLHDYSVIADIFNWQYNCVYLSLVCYSKFCAFSPMIMVACLWTIFLCRSRCGPLSILLLCVFLHHFIFAIVQRMTSLYKYNNTIYSILIPLLKTLLQTVYFTNSALKFCNTEGSFQ